MSCPGTISLFINVERMVGFKGLPTNFFGLSLPRLRALLLKQLLNQPRLIRYPVCVGWETRYPL